MKKIIMIVMTMLGFTAIYAQSPSTQKEQEAKPAVKPMDSIDKEPASDPLPPTDAIKSNPDKSTNFVGTNDLNLYILREGIKRS